MKPKPGQLRLSVILFVLLSLGCGLLESPTVAIQSTEVARFTVTGFIVPLFTPQSTNTPWPSQTFTPMPRPITWDELVQFISNDHTNWNEYDLVNYNCVHYAIDLVAAAHRQDLKAWIVIVEFYDKEPGHAFAAFETTDHGTVYIEPQGDNPYWVMEVGKPLCDAWGVYECMGTVKSIEYYQCMDADHCQLYTP